MKSKRMCELAKDYLENDCLWSLNLELSCCQWWNWVKKDKLEKQKEILKADIVLTSLDSFLLTVQKAPLPIVCFNNNL